MLPILSRSPASWPLLQRGEATYRTAVSRAYCAFHLATSFLAELGFSAPRTANVHVFVQYHLNGSDQPAALNAASLLSDLHAARNRADYQLSNHTAETQAFAKLCVETAHEVRDALLACRQSPIREQVHTGITAYVQRIAGHRSKVEARWTSPARCPARAMRIISSTSPRLSPSLSAIGSADRRWWNADFACATRPGRNTADRSELLSPGTQGIDRAPGGLGHLSLARFARMTSTPRSSSGCIIPRRSKTMNSGVTRQTSRR